MALRHSPDISQRSLSLCHISPYMILTQTYETFVCSYRTLCHITGSAMSSLDSACLGLLNSVEKCRKLFRSAQADVTRTDLRVGRSENQTETLKRFCNYIITEGKRTAKTRRMGNGILDRNRCGWGEPV